MESACKENLGCLQAVLESQNGYFRNEKYLKQVRGEYQQSMNIRSFLYIIAALYIGIQAILSYLSLDGMW